MEWKTKVALKFEASSGSEKKPAGSFDMPSILRWILAYWKPLTTAIAFIGGEVMAFLLRHPEVAVFVTALLGALPGILLAGVFAVWGAITRRKATEDEPAITTINKTTPETEVCKPQIYLSELKPCKEPEVLGGIHDIYWLNGEKFEDSLSAHPAADSCMSTITFKIPDGYCRLSGAVGIADRNGDGVTITHSASPLSFRIVGDEDVLWPRQSHSLREAGSRLPFDVDLTGVRVLTLRVQCHVRNNGSAWAMWIKPILSASPAASRESGPVAGTLDQSPATHS